MKKLLLKSIALSLSASMLFSSCATLLTSSYTTVRFQSDKEGKVYQNISQIGNTNADIKIKRKDIEKLYTIKTQGCPDVQMELPVKTNPAFWADVILIFALGAGLIPAYIDVAFENNKTTDKVFQVNSNKCVD